MERACLLREATPHALFGGFSGPFSLIFGYRIKNEKPSNTYS